MIIHAYSSTQTDPPSFLACKYTKRVRSGISESDGIRCGKDGRSREREGEREGGVKT